MMELAFRPKDDLTPGTGLKPPDALDLFQRAGQADMHARLGATYAELGQLEHACAMYGKAVLAYRLADDLKKLSFTLVNYGRVARQCGHYHDAIEALQEAHAHYQSMEDMSGSATALTSLGQAFDALGDHLAAVGAYEQALVPLTHIKGADEWEANTLDTLGTAWRKAGNLSEAVEAHGAALKLRRACDDKRGEGVTLHLLGLAYQLAGAASRALTAYEWALRLRQQTGDREGEVRTSYNLATIYAEMNLYQEAEALLNRVVDLEARLNHPDLLADEEALVWVRGRRRELGLAPPGEGTDDYQRPDEAMLSQTQPTPRPPTGPLPRPDWEEPAS